MGTPPDLSSTREGGQGRERNYRKKPQLSRATAVVGILQKRGLPVEWEHHGRGYKSREEEAMKQAAGRRYREIADHLRERLSPKGREEQNQIPAEE